MALMAGVKPVASINDVQVMMMYRIQTTSTFSYTTSTTQQQLNTNID